MKFKSLLIMAIALAVLLAAFWPKSYISKEGFILEMGEMVDDVSALSAGFSFVYHLRLPTGFDTVCFEQMNVTLLQKGEVYSAQIPGLLAQERFCSSNDFYLKMTNRGDNVEVQKA